MYKNVLIATDGSELATKGLECGLALAGGCGAKATIVFVTEPWVAFAATGDFSGSFPIEEYEESVAQGAESVLGSAKAKADSAGVPCAVLHVKDQYPAEGILEAARANGCDLIVMASHGRRGVTRLMLGSQANRVVTHSTMPVLIYR